MLIEGRSSLTLLAWHLNSVNTVDFFNEISRQSHTSSHSFRISNSTDKLLTTLFLGLSFCQSSTARSPSSARLSRVPSCRRRLSSSISGATIRRSRSPSSARQSEERCNAVRAAWMAGMSEI
jgi:hypothetical protein